MALLLQSRRRGTKKHKDTLDTMRLLDNGNDEMLFESARFSYEIHENLIKLAVPFGSVHGSLTQASSSIFLLVNARRKLS